MRNPRIKLMTVSSPEKLHFKTRGQVLSFMSVHSPPTVFLGHLCMKQGEDLTSSVCLSSLLHTRLEITFGVGGRIKLCYPLATNDNNDSG